MPIIDPSVFVNFPNMPDLVDGKFCKEDGEVNALFMDADDDKEGLSSLFPNTGLVDLLAPSLAMMAVDSIIADNFLVA